MAKAKVSSRNKMMDYLAHREHSEKELREKLNQQFSPEEIDAAIEYGKKHAWIPSSSQELQALSNQAADALHRKKKGILYINSFLQQKGLPEVQPNSSLELEKAQDLVKNKYKKEPSSNKRDQQIARFLASRGFDSDIIEQVVQDLF
jgi:regulatory protein